MSSTITTSVVTGGSNNHSTVSSEANAYATDFVSAGVLGTTTNTNGSSPSTGSFAVNQDASPDMGVTVSGAGNTGSGASVAYVTCTPGSQDKQVLRARMTADYTGYTINANSSGSTVYDWIYLKADATNAATPDAGADNVITLYTSRSTSNTADNGSPPTYGTLLAVVTVANGASSITNANIADKRTQAALSVPSTASSGWTAVGTAITYSANGGMREFNVTASTDLTGTLSPGMYMKFTRSVTPPTQCLSFTAASNQYATKASPAGITFTGPFTCEAWIYLNSYTGQTQYIINRENSTITNGWRFIIDSVGRVFIEYASSSAATNFQSYQSVPLKQWVHVAGVVTSVSSKTGQIYINGTSVATVSGASAATTLTQSSDDLRLGAVGGGTLTNTYFDGFMSEVRLWSTNQTQSSIQANMTKNLVGNETNLIGLWQGNGAWTDATSNANTLTANGGASNSQSNNPYNATEYGRIIAVSYSNPTTTISLRTGVSGTIPNMTLNSPSYSTSERPYGLPAGTRSRVIAYIPIQATQSTTSTTPANLNGAGATLTIPTGFPSLKLEAFVGAVGSATANIGGLLTIWEGNANTGTNLFTSSYFIGTVTGQHNSPVWVGGTITPTSGSHTYNVGIASNVGASNVDFASSVTEPAYLKISEEG